jgi:hypothetical protein
MNDFLKFIKTIYNFNNDFDKVFELEGLLSNTHNSLLREFLYGTQLFEKDYFKKYVSDYNHQTDFFLFRDPISLKEDIFKYQNFKGEVKEIWSGIK